MLHLVFILSELFIAVPCSSARTEQEDLHFVHKTIEGEMEEIYWPNGQLLQRGHIRNGKYEGIFELWWEDGTRHSRKKFRQGVLIDTSLFWHGNGELSEMVILEDGNPLWTQSWSINAMLKFQSIRIKDSMYHDMKWDEKGRLTLDTVQIYPKVRLEQNPPAKGKD